MMIAPHIDGTVAIPRDEAGELFDSFLVGTAALVDCGEFRLAEDAGVGITAGPGNQGAGAGGKQINPIEGTLLFVEADDIAANLVFAHIFLVEIQVKRGLEFTGMGATAWELALTPRGQEGLIDGEKIPPGGHDTFGIRLEIRASCDQI